MNNAKCVAQSLILSHHAHTRTFFSSLVFAEIREKCARLLDVSRFHEKFVPDPVLALWLKATNTSPLSAMLEHTTITCLPCKMSPSSSLLASLDSSQYSGRCFDEHLNNAVEMWLLSTTNEEAFSFLSSSPLLNGSWLVPCFCLAVSTDFPQIWYFDWLDLCRYMLSHDSHGRLEMAHFLPFSSHYTACRKSIAV